MEFARLQGFPLLGLNWCQRVPLVLIEQFNMVNGTETN